MKMQDMPIGVVNCLRLHVYSKPSLDSDVVWKRRCLTEVIVDVGASTGDFYKIYTAIGAEGFCQKDLLTIK